MSLLLKRRSRSETRPKDIPDKSKQQTQPQQKPKDQERSTQMRSKPHASEQSLNKLGISHQQQPQSSSYSMAGGMGRRKTSAELISEAKLFLGDTVAGVGGGAAGGAAAMQMMATGGARLVSTRRPITPREPGRVLYGKVALAGRPPSAFSMRYLQNEKPTPRQLPALSGTGPTTPMPTRNGALLGQSTTETLIELLKQHSGLKDCTNETVQHINAILQELYTRVRKQERSFKRGFILGGLYGLVECTSPRVLLAVARVVLALRVTGSNLTGACKLIFKVARHEQNDALFHDNDVMELLIDGLGHASPLDEPEACIYAYGCIRFLTASCAQDRDDALNRNWIGLGEAITAPLSAPVSATLAAVPAAVLCPRKLTGQQTLVARLARHGAVELMILHLQMLNEAGATKRLSGPPLHTLYQLSAAMRALADVSQQQQRLQLQLKLACPHLIRAAEISMGELEVQTNVVRTLSVLSEDSDCCETLHNYAARIGLLLGPSCSSASTSERVLAVLSRLGYMLGNILAKHESARIQYFHNDVAMEYLLNVLEQLGERSTSTVALLDAQIKLIRVVANMSVNPEVGADLGNIRTLGSVLLKLLSRTSASLAKNKSAEQQELLHATLGALHNLCFYQDKQPTDSVAVPAPTAGSLQSLIDELSASLAEVLANCQTAATKVELTRVLGNLTRNEGARRRFCAAGGLPLMVQQLTREAAGQDYELRTCAIGVLVNLLGDGEQRGPFLQLRGAELLSLLLRGSLEQEDWFLANIVCQALWNLLIDGQCAATLCRSGSILDEVSDLLADYLDEDRLNAGDDDDEQACEDDHVLDTENETFDGDHDVLWEDFALVATDLLERIQNNFDRQQQQQSQTIVRSTDNDDDGDVFIEEM
ncbi:armadillo repeat-containing protein 2 [Drosophila guanche]|uniref:Blast:Armadillo repeat-containing protein 2 n=1 Tax=Drosophila guanche TaxID=7266 RepID=A0A3B0KL78_DROGU|nr:armadillo repeat-containing protein 2 [Drosophila guanche]SPP86576.1 blast:Armadillo repeat-containing protein 2 [Drosophila guanche]